MRDDYQQGYDEMDYHDPYPQHSQTHEKPLDPAVERVRRKLMRLMVISVGVTMLLIVAVLVAVIYKVMSPSPSQQETAAQTVAAASPAQAIPPAAPSIPEFIKRTVELPAGTRILSQSISGDLVSLETLTPQGNSELVIYDYRNGNLIAGVTLITPEISSGQTTPQQ